MKKFIARVSIYFREITKWDEEKKLTIFGIKKEVKDIGHVTIEIKKEVEVISIPFKIKKEVEKFEK
jgi:hypothetical protein